MTRRAKAGIDEAPDMGMSRRIIAAAYERLGVDFARPGGDRTAFVYGGRRQGRTHVEGFTFYDPPEERPVLDAVRGADGVWRVGDG